MARRCRLVVFQGFGCGLVIDDILHHAEQCQPLECCGLVVRVDGVDRYWPCRNLAIERNRFELDPLDWIAAEEAGEIIKVVHSHVYQAAEPTPSDRVGCEASGKPWLIVSWPTGSSIEINPCGYTLPLLGREFVWGVADCYTLVRDYYRTELSILIDEFGGYPSNFVEAGDDLYLSRFTAAGFVVVDAPAKHDVLLMQIGNTAVTGHAAVYIGDAQIMHHVIGRLSMRQPYGGYWRDATRKILRHESLC